MNRRVALLTALVGYTGCALALGPGDDLDDGDWRRSDTAHFRIYRRPASYAEANLAAIGDGLEQQLAHVNESLELDYRGPVSIYLYESPRGLGTDDCGGVAFPEEEALKTVSSAECGTLGAADHELAHVILGVTLGGAATGFMSEGLASAMAPTFWGSSLDVLVRDRLSRGGVPTIPQLAKVAFLDKEDKIVAGSFLLFVLDQYGAGVIKRLFCESSGDGFAEDFERIAGLALTEVEAAWQQHCAAAVTP